MTRYRGYGVPWKAHRIIVQRVVEKIKERLKSDPFFEMAYRMYNAWQPVSPVDDTGWLEFYAFLDMKAKELKEKKVVAK